MVPHGARGNQSRVPGLPVLTFISDDGRSGFFEAASHRRQLHLQLGDLCILGLKLFLLLFELPVLPLQLIEQHRSEQLIAHAERFAGAGILH